MATMCASPCVVGVKGKAWVGCLPATRPPPPQRRCRRLRPMVVAGEKCSSSTVPFEDQKEEARRQRRTMFTHEEWRRHRSTDRYLHHIATITESGVVKSIVVPVLAMTGLATALATYCWAFAAHPQWFPCWAPPPPNIAIEPIQLTSAALSLLLVFRTNASYARWEEARRRFGCITTISRDIARQVFAWMPSNDSRRIAALGRWLVALGRCSMVHFRGEEHDLRAELSHVLTQQELNKLVNTPHGPNYCLQVLTKLVAASTLPNELLLRIDENMTKLTEAVSACERIINTPIPLSYTRHTSRFLMAWLCSVPFALWSYCGWAMVPLTALISFVLLGIEEIGVYIEEPFSVMALEGLCDRMEVSINTMSREQSPIRDYVTGLTPGEDGTAARTLTPVPLNGDSVVSGHSPALAI